MIISLFTPCISHVTKLKRFGLISSRLYTVVHHHHKIQSILNGYDKLIYLSEHIRNKDVNMFELKNTITIDWSPDIQFYDTVLAKNKDNTECYEVFYDRLFFVSTGKTSRDHNLAYDAFTSLKVHLLVFDETLSSNSYVHVTPKAGYIDMINKMLFCCVNFVPCINNEDYLCGLTSVLDGLALGMPLLMSDNTNISFNIEKEGFGLYYKAGDLTDLKDKISFMISHPQELECMGKRAREFAEIHSYRRYCNELYKIITKD